MRYEQVHAVWDYYDGVRIGLADLDKSHGGDAKIETHPGRGGVDATYDELQFRFDDQIAILQELPTLYGAKFRALPGQDGLPEGMLRELEVAWLPSPA